MANQLTSYKCPKCTAPLRFDAVSGVLKCDYCDSSFSKEEIEAIYEEALRKAEEAGLKEQGSREETDSNKAESGMDALKDMEGMHAYNCPSCGAELITDVNTIATGCPYCGNPALVPKNFGGMLKPDCLLPFRLEKEAAKEALRKFYRGKHLLPDSFAEENRISEIQGVYAPFWLFDGEAEAYGRFNAKKIRNFRSGNTEITETSHYIVKRRGTVSFSSVPVDASEKLPDEYMDAIEPFLYDELEPFSTAYLPGFLANKYDLSSDVCLKRAEERIKNTAFSAIERDVSGYTSKTCEEREVEFHGSRVRYGLMPVYMLSTRWEGENYLFAMNGQTGRLVGRLPIDKGKYRRLFFGTILLITLFLGTLFKIVMDWESGSALWSFIQPYVISAGIAFVVSFLLCQSMKAGMNTARQRQTADFYTAPDGVSIWEREDRFTHTSRSQRQIPNKR